MNTPHPFNDAIHLSHDLCAHDAQAMEALIDAGFDCAKVAPEMRSRAERCSAVLGLLGCGAAPVCDGSLIDATLVRVAWSRRAQELSELAPRDEDALEALVVAGFDPARCPSSIRELAIRHAATLSGLSVPLSAAERETLVSRTLAGVQANIDSGQKRLVMDPAEGRARVGFRWGDLISVAALLLIASAVVAPMVGAVRGMSQQAGCRAGLVNAFRGFSSYANDYKESLPLASASLAGSRWWDIGRPEHSNSANLYTLLRAKYANSADLACPGNATACRDVPAPGAMDWTCSDAISYSYRSQFVPERMSWAQATAAPFVVVADRSPVIVRAMRNEWINPLANSDNHAGRGQNVMLSDGTIRWMATPVLADGDNIWLPRTLEEVVARLQNPTRAEPLHGNETPAGKSDVFLSP
jgi:hypothetical protein